SAAGLSAPPRRWPRKSGPTGAAGTSVRPWPYSGVSTALSFGVDVRIMRYEEDKPSTSRAWRSDAGAGRVPAPLPRPLRPLRGDARAGALPDRDAHRAPQQELRH